MSTQPVISELPQTSPTQDEGHRQPASDVSSPLFPGPIDIRSVALSGIFILLLLFVVSVTRGLLLPHYPRLFSQLSLCPVRP